MSNHYHIVLHVDRDEALFWDDTEIIRRWLQLFDGHPLAREVERMALSLDGYQLVHALPQ